MRDQFPVLYSNAEIVIYLNPSREIFITHKPTSVGIRMDADRRGLYFTTENCNEVEPDFDKSCWVIAPRSSFRAHDRKMGKPHGLPYSDGAIVISQKEEKFSIAVDGIGVEMILNPYEKGLAFVVKDNAVVRPTHVNGFIGWAIHPRRFAPHCINSCGASF